MAPSTNCEPPQQLRPHAGNLPLVLIASMGADPSLAWLGGAELGVQVRHKWLGAEAGLLDAPSSPVS